MKIESPEDRDIAIAEIAESAVEIDPSLSAEAFQSISSDSAVKSDLLQQCVGLLMARSVDEALAWADLLGSPADVDAAKGTIATTLAESDPMRAIEVVSGSGIPPQDPNSPLSQVIQTWAVSAPQDAASWALAVRSAESRKVVLKSVATQWLTIDPQAAFSWLSTLNQPARRDDATRALAESLIDIPEILRESVLQSADPQVRSELEQQVDQLTVDD